MSPMPVVWSARCRDHDPDGEVWVGVRLDGSEVAERVDRIHAAVSAADHPLREARPHPDDDLLVVHDPDLVSHLRGIHGAWVSAGFPDEPGQDRVVPYVFPTQAMLGGLPASRAAAVHGRAGQYGYDTMTLVGPGTWAAARAAVDCALTAVDLVVAGASSAYALCRPPGHHVSHGAYGGSCYLNNAAVAAQALRRRGHGRVAVVDIDAHHGNGTSAIFYGRGDVFYGSVHVDPAAGWFPHFVGHAGEAGAGDGRGTNLNVPLAPGSGDEAFLAGVDRVLEAVSGFAATALVVSLGVDAAADDPESPLQVTVDGYAAAGARLAACELPTVLVQEGGYHLPSLGGLVVATLAAWD